MNKKVTKLFLLLMALLAPSVGWAQEATVTTQGMTFTWDTNYYVLTSFDAAAYADANGITDATFRVNFPETIGELTGNGEPYDIGGIGEDVFSNVMQLSAIELPAILSRIDANAFKNCQNLTEVFFNGPLNNVAIDDNAFYGVGTAEKPMKVICNNWDFYGAFFKYVTGLVEWTDGVAEWKGAKIWTSESINGCFSDGYMVDYLLNGCYVSEEGLWYKITGARKLTGEDLPDWFDGNYEFYLSDSWYIDEAGNVPVKAVKDGAFDGLGTETEPVEMLNPNIKFMKNLGTTFSNGIAKLAGGNFQLTMRVNTDNIDVFYAYNETDGQGEYIGVKTAKWVNAPNDATEFTLVINDNFDEWDYEAQTTLRYPVTTIKAGFADGVKDIATGVRFYIGSENPPTFEDGALTGIGSTTAPMELTTDIAIFKEIGGDLSTGLLAGGYFKLIREEWAGQGFDQAKYELINGEYVLAKPIQAWDGFTGDYNLDLYTQFYDDWDNETQTYKTITKVAEIKKSAFDEIRDKNISYVYFEGANATAIEDGAFQGFGTAEAPMRFQGSAPVTLLTNLQATATDGVYNIAGGFFQMIRIDNLIKYALNGDEYIVTGYDEEGVQRYIDNQWDIYLNIYNSFREWYVKDDGTEEKKDFFVTKIKANAFNGLTGVKSVYFNAQKLTEIGENAFKGFGTAEAPMTLNADAPVALLKSLNATPTDGVYNLGGGFFQVIRQNGYVLYALNGEEYTAVGYVEDAQTVINNGEKIQINITNGFDERAQNEDGSYTWKYYPVTKIKADAFDGLTGVNDVSINAEQLTEVGENAFKGFGTAEAPMDIEGNIAMISKLGTIGNDGVISLGNGSFKYTYISYGDGINVKAQLASPITNGLAELTVVGYEQFDGWDNYSISINGDSYYSAGGTEINMRTTKIAANAFEGIQDVKSVTINGTYLKEIGENAFAGIGTQSTTVPLSISPVLVNRFKDQIEGSKLAGGFFDIVRVYNDGNFRSYYSYVDGAYELTKVECTIDANSGYINTTWSLFILTGFEDYAGEPVEWTDINGNTITDYYPVTYVTKIKADALANVKIPSTLATTEPTYSGPEAITSITIQDYLNNTKIEIEDGAFAGIGTVEKGASFTAKNAIVSKNIGNKVADGIYDIKGGYFALKAITIKAQKSPNGHDYAICNASTSDGNGNWITLIDWNDDLSPEMMKAPADGDDYYTYTFLGANTITDLRIYEVEEFETNGQTERIYYNEAYATRQTLEINRDTTFIWNDVRDKLVLEGAPIEYEFWLGGRYVTEENAADILGNGKATFDAENNVLTLDGIDARVYGDGFTTYNKNMTVKLIGDNTIRPTDSQYAYSNINIYAPTTIKGDGILNLIGSNKEVTEDNGNWGNVYGYYDLTISDGATVNISRVYGFTDWATVTIDNATLSIDEVKNTRAFGASNLVLNGAEIRVPAGGEFRNGAIFDAEGNYAKSVLIAAAGNLSVVVAVTNLDTNKTAKAELIIDNNGAVSGIALPTDMAQANYAIELPEKVAGAEGQVIPLTAIADNAFAGTNLKKIVLPLDNGFVNIGAGAVNAKTMIVAPVGYLKQYMEMATIADNVESELLAGGLTTDKKVVTLGVEVAVIADANAKYYMAVAGEEAETLGVPYEGEVIPAKTGLLVETDDDVDYIELVITSEVADNTPLFDNLLRPVFVDTDLSNDDCNYILNGDTFYRARTQDDPVVKAGHAYLFDTSRPGMAGLTLSLQNDTPTGINELSVDDENAEWYSVNGQRINKPTRKGIYIKNGKKVTVK